MLNNMLQYYTILQETYMEILQSKMESGITKSSLWLFALSWLQRFSGSFNRDETVIFVILIIREPPKKVLNANQSMQNYQIMINNLTILHNTTQYSINNLNTTQYYTILQSITCPKSSCLLPSQASSSLSCLALLLSLGKHLRKLNVQISKVKRL